MNTSKQPLQSADSQLNNDIKENVQKKTYPCPHCEALTQWHDNPYKPFCSDRCKLIDLGAWANEEYRVPHTENY